MVNWEYLFAKKYKVSVAYGEGMDRLNRCWFSPYWGKKTVEVVLFKNPVVAGFRHAYWEELQALEKLPIRGPLEVFSKIYIRPRMSGATEHPVLVFRKDGYKSLGVETLGDSFMAPRFLRYAMVRK